MRWDRIGAMALYVRSAVLTMSGLSALCVAAWLTDMRLGLAAVGVSLILLDVLSHTDPGEAKT